MVYRDVLEELFNVISNEDTHIPKKYLGQYNKLYAHRENTFEQMKQYVEECTSKDNKQRINGFLNEINKVEEEIMNISQLANFVAGFEYGAKIMSAIYNLH